MSTRKKENKVLPGKVFQYMMAEENPRRKTRSASICAPGFSSMEKMLDSIPPSGLKERERESGSGTPEGSTPIRKRRPATRSQSARVTSGGKSIRRRAAAQGELKFFYSIFLFTSKVF